LIQKVTVRVAGVLTIFVVRPSASAFRRSGGTLVMTSASPFSSATMRGKSSGIGFQTMRAVRLHHEPLVLHPLDEAVGAGPDRPARELLDAVLGREPRGQDLRPHLRHAHEEQRVGLLGDDADRRGAHDLDGLERREARMHDGLARHEVALERRRGT
jgi:hypothetical protein